MKRAFFGLLVSMALFLLSGPAIITHAQEVGLSVSPSFVDSIIKPGANMPVTFIIENTADPVIAQMKVVVLEPSEDSFGFNIDHDLGRGPAQLKMLDTTGKKIEEAILLNSKERKNVQLSILMPENIKDGSYYYGLLITIINPISKNKHTLVKFQPQFIAPILLSVSRNTQTENKIRINEMSISNGFTMNLLGKKIVFIDSFKKPLISTIVENNGPYHTKVGARLLHYRAFEGRKTLKLPTLTVFPYTNRVLYQTSLDRYLVGPQEILINMLPEGSPKQLRSSVHFFAVPLRFALLVLAILAVAYLFSSKKRNSL